MRDRVLLEVPALESASPRGDRTLRDIEAVEALAVMLDRNLKPPAVRWRPSTRAYPTNAHDLGRVPAPRFLGEAVMFVQIGEVGQKGEIGIVRDFVFYGSFADSRRGTGSPQRIFDVIGLYVERLEVSVSRVDSVGAQRLRSARKEAIQLILRDLPPHLPGSLLPPGARAASAVAIAMDWADIVTATSIAVSPQFEHGGRSIVFVSSFERGAPQRLQTTPVISDWLNPLLPTAVR